MEKTVKGRIFNIQRFSIHDGPGIRTVVFLKGCPLRCKWCANPESQNPDIEIAWTSKKCIRCGECLRGALDCNPFFEEDELFWGDLGEEDPNTIRHTCPSTALHTIGFDATVKEILAKIGRDSIFYGDEEGGLTISGGEPLLQPKFTYHLLKAAKDNGINTTIETTGFGNTADFIKIAGKLDYLIMDIKSLDDEVHKKWTGVSNERILDNFSLIKKSFPDLPIHIRTPIIPGVNDDEKSISQIHDFIGNCKNIRYELLKYHKLGVPKYESLHRMYPMGDADLDDEIFEELKAHEFNNIPSQLEDIGWQKGAGI